MPTKPSFGSDKKTPREHLLKLLHHALQEEVVLSATIAKCLGAITGPNFHSLYRLFGDHRRQIERWLAEIAERTRTLGAVARGAGDEIARTAPAAVAPPPRLPAPSMVRELLALHEGIAERIRLRLELVGSSVDAATRDFVTRLVEFHETAAWVLRMVLHGPKVPADGH